ncbi:FGGY family carbohydrate kinase [Microbacterium esteraromaticum]|uniref:FGGY family carbohydrate kinase n=1 Tax=Microbacterium esteraromaticum TaxID=57043 RepID=UPI0015F55EAC|nr:FGGY family carbohydrate kinase [Microbacterium esteraromaticum]
MSGNRRLSVACGVDIGSTNVKVIALDSAGHIVARASRPTPRDEEQLSIDAAVLFASIEEMLVEVCGDRFLLAAVSCSGVGEDGVLVDERLRPLTQALAWFDPRRHRIFRALRPSLGSDESFDAESDAVRTLVGWAWARVQAVQGEARSWVAIADFAGALWSGSAFMSDTLASRTGAWRSLDRRWAEDRVMLTLGATDLLPPVVPSGSVVGHLDSPTLRAADVLDPEALVVAGGHDHPIGGWAADQLAPGAVLDSMGTAEVVVAQSPNGRIDRASHLEVAPGILSSGTTLLRVEELSRNLNWAAQDPDVAVAIRTLMDGAMEPAPVLDSGYFVPGTRGGQLPSYALDAPKDPHARASAVLGALAHLGRDAVGAVLGGSDAPVKCGLPVDGCARRVG